jgi:GTP-binding protein YchF
MLKAGIVGLPNVGKSTLFNALTRSHKAAAENYPFCTIDPNLGVVNVPEPRLEPLARIAKVSTIIPTAIEFVDIAGLVAGASKGEGLGNQFLANIREVDAIVQVVRCFEDPDVVHTMGGLDPIRDIEVVTTELVLADLESLKNRKEKVTKHARGGEKEALVELALLERVEAHLDTGKPANLLHIYDEERVMLRQFQLLTAKPVVFAANVAEADLANPDANPLVTAVKKYAREHLDSGAVVICSKLEADLVDLTPAEAAEFLQAAGAKGSGVDDLIRETHRVLGLISFFTYNEKETRAWTIKAGTKAPQAAGVIHTDFEKGFIKADVVRHADLVKYGSAHAAREAGHHAIEGRDYVVQDGDVILFRFSH